MRSEWEPIPQDYGLPAAPSAEFEAMPVDAGARETIALLRSGQKKRSALAALDAGRADTIPSLLEEARKIARNMATKSPLGLRLTKEALDRNTGAMSLEDAIRLEDRNQAMCIAELAMGGMKKD